MFGSLLLLPQTQQLVGVAPDRLFLYSLMWSSKGQYLFSIKNIYFKAVIELPSSPFQLAINAAEDTLVFRFDSQPTTLKFFPIPVPKDEAARLTEPAF